MVAGFRFYRYVRGSHHETEYLVKGRYFLAPCHHISDGSFLRAVDFLNEFFHITDFISE